MRLSLAVLWSWVTLCCAFHMPALHANPLKQFKPFAKTPASNALRKTGLFATANAIQPLNNFVFVKSLQPETQTASGIFLAQTDERRRSSNGRVIAAGPGRFEYTTGVKLPMSVQTGQSVLYRSFDSTKVKLDNEEHVFIRDEDVLLTFTGDKISLDSVAPTLDHVLIRTEKPETTTSSGIVTSTTEDQPASQGEVVKVGPGGRKPDGQQLPMQVAVGDLVKFREHMGIDVKIDGTDYIVCSIAEILCKLGK